MSAMSGRCSRASATASRAVGGLGHHLDVVLDVEQRAEPAADQRLVVDQQTRIIDDGVHRQLGATVKPPSPGLGAQLAAEGGDPFAHPEQPDPGHRWLPASRAPSSSTRTVSERGR